MIVRVPILTYHSIDGSGSVISTSPEQFRQQMLQLQESSCHVVSLQAIVKALRENRELPENPVAITFDDGFETVYSHAFPILQAYHFPATIFLVTSCCGQASVWNSRTPRIGSAPLATWQQVGEMSRGAIDIGSHTATHPDLTRIPPDVAEEEIRTSRQIIEDRLGREVSAFAYPFGRSNSSVRVLVAREYDCACSTRLGVVGASSALDQLQRIEMHYFSSRKRFTALLRGRASSYLAVRRFLRLVRSVADPILSSA